jgi:hypothetical protein
MKKEVSFGAGSRIPGKKAIEAITMQLNRGSPSDNVYADLQALIFHSDLYESDVTESIIASQRRLKEELDELAQGKLSPKLRARISRAASLSADDYEMLNFESRSQLQKHIDQATSLQRDLILGRENTANIKGLNARLIKFLKKDYLKTAKIYQTYKGKIPEPTMKEGLYHFTRPQDVFANVPVLPFSQRNSIDTESRVATAFGKMKLGVEDSPATKTVELPDGRSP